MIGTVVEIVNTVVVVAVAVAVAVAVVAKMGIYSSHMVVVVDIHTPFDFDFDFDFDIDIGVGAGVGVDLDNSNVDNIHYYCCCYFHDMAVVIVDNYNLHNIGFDNRTLDRNFDVFAAVVVLVASAYYCTPDIGHYDVFYEIQTHTPHCNPDKVSLNLVGY